MSWEARHCGWRAEHPAHLWGKVSESKEMFGYEIVSQETLSCDGSTYFPPAPPPRPNCTCGHKDGWHLDSGVCLWPTGYPEERECSCNKYVPEDEE